MEITLTQILSELREFTNNHKELQSFQFGPIANISTKDVKYPLMHIEPSTAYNNGHQLVLGFNMYILDLEKQDYSNLETIMNSTLLIGNDVISEYWMNGTFDDKWDIIEDTVTITPVQFAFDDVLAGYNFNIEIEIENRLTNCNLPIDE